MPTTLIVPIKTFGRALITRTKLVACLESLIQHAKRRKVVFSCATFGPRGFCLRRFPRAVILLSLALAGARVEDQRVVPTEHPNDTQQELQTDFEGLASGNAP